MSGVKIDTSGARRQTAAMRNYYDQVKSAINDVVKTGVPGWKDAKTKEYNNALTETAKSVSSGIGVIREYSSQLDELIRMLES